MFTSPSEKISNKTLTHMDATKYNICNYYMNIAILHLQLSNGRFTCGIIDIAYGNITQATPRLRSYIA